MFFLGLCFCVDFLFSLSVCLYILCSSSLGCWVSMQINNDNNNYYYYSTEVPFWLIIIEFRYFYWVNLNSKQIYAVVRSLTFHMNCRTFWINLMVFCTFFLFFSQINVQYLCICVLSHSSAHLATGPALLSLRVNKLNLMKRYYQDIEEKILFLNIVFLTIIILLNTAVYVFLLFVFFVCFFVFSYIPALSLYWPYDFCASTLTINNWIIVIIIIIIINLHLC